MVRASCPHKVYFTQAELAVTLNWEEGRGFGQLYFSLLMSVFFSSPTYYGGVVWWAEVAPATAMREIEIVTASVVLDQVFVTVWLTPRFAIRVPRDAIAI